MSVLDQVQFYICSSKLISSQITLAIASSVLNYSMQGTMKAIKSKNQDWPRIFPCLCVFGKRRWNTGLKIMRLDVF